jgi:hypothetical protein
MAGVVNGVTFFYERSRRGLDTTGERGLAESVICCFFGSMGPSMYRKNICFAVVLWQC